MLYAFLQNLKSIPAYGLLGAAGVGFGFLYLLLYGRVRHRSVNDLVYVYIWAAVGAMAGAKLLYLLLESKNIAALLAQPGVNVWETIRGCLLGGFVFYGGLFGALAGAALSARYFRMNVPETLDTLIPVMPLAHAFGRVGCCVTGCCYGMPWSGPMAVVYTSSEYAPNGVGLFPVQTVEAAADLILFAVLAARALKGKERPRPVHIYLIVYALVRFGLEFLRGDAVRGALAGLSTSQWISLGILAFELIVFVRSRVRKHGN